MFKIKNVMGGHVVRIPDDGESFFGAALGLRIRMLINHEDVAIAKYKTSERADEVFDELRRAYYSGVGEYTLPKE